MANVVSQELYSFTSDSQVATKTSLDGGLGLYLRSRWPAHPCGFTSTNAAIESQDIHYATMRRQPHQPRPSWRGEVLTTNGLNQYTTATGTTYTYDADGNLATKVDASGTWTYTYDIEGQLTKAVVPGSDTGSTAMTRSATGSRPRITGCAKPM